MRKSKQKKSWREVLCFSKVKANQATIRTYYRLYRAEIGLAPRCDNESCVYYNHELSWNGSPLPLILDHINGVRNNNRPQNLRYFCPNCDSQLDTRGGRNKGRVLQVTDAGYVIIDRNRKRHYTLVAGTGTFKLHGSDAKLTHTKAMRG